MRTYGYTAREQSNPDVDVYLSKTKKWQQEYEKWRMILDCQLIEKLKRGFP
ncbi:hypothetical protein [Peribacillus simplex]|uniref:hypothetical protein n=1 Tax=Peribacillus simplex TaxID=1478 RepID=UPI003D2A0AD5